jgi:hypothetical protein
MWVLGPKLNRKLLDASCLLLVVGVEDLALEVLGWSAGFGCWCGIFSLYFAILLAIYSIFGISILVFGLGITLVVRVLLFLGGSLVTMMSSIPG